MLAAPQLDIRQITPGLLSLLVQDTPGVAKPRSIQDSERFSAR